MGKTPEELLATMDSKDFAEWEAYEKVAGPVDGSYAVEALATINERLDSICFLMGAAHFTDDKTSNPISPPTRYPRPPFIDQEDKEAIDNHEVLSGLDEFC